MKHKAQAQVQNIWTIDFEGMRKMGIIYSFILVVILMITSRETSLPFGLIQLDFFGFLCVCLCDKLFVGIV